MHPPQGHETRRNSRFFHPRESASLTRRFAPAGSNRSRISRGPSAHDQLPTELNAAPTDLLRWYAYDRRAGDCSLDLLRRGSIPHWAKDIKVGFANINAKAEVIENR